MERIFELRPLQPRLFTTWSVILIVLNYLKFLSPPEDLSLKQLTLKVFMLSSLISAARCNFLHQIDFNVRYFKNDGYVFQVSGLVKGSKPHSHIWKYFFLPFHLTLNYVLLLILKDITSSKRNKSSSRNILFLLYIKTRKALKASSTSKLPENVLRLSDVDTSQFSAHSTRSVSSTLAANSGVSISDIMKVADWSSAGTFKKFYRKPILDSYAHRVLSSSSSVGNSQPHYGENEVDRG